MDVVETWVEKQIQWEKDICSLLPLMFLLMGGHSFHTFSGLNLGVLMNTICSFSSSQASQPSHTLLCSTLVLSLEISILHLALHLGLSLTFESLNVARNPLHSPPNPLWIPSPASFFKNARLIASSPLTSSQAPISLQPLSNPSQELCPSFPYHSQWHQIHWETLAKTGIPSLPFPLICPVLKLCLAP